MTHLDMTKKFKGSDEDIVKALGYLSFLTKEKHNKVLLILGRISLWGWFVELFFGLVLIEPFFN